MSVITQYLIVIVIYFVAMLGIGILAGRKITNDGDDYFLAKDKLSAAAIGFSFSATQMSGSTYLGTVGTLSTIGYPGRVVFRGGSVVLLYSAGRSCPAGGGPAQERHAGRHH